MTEELLSEVVGKMIDACESRVIFKYSSVNVSSAQWYVYREPEGTRPYTPFFERYSPILTLCQLVDWCEAWLRGAEEIIAIFSREKLQ